MHQILSTDGSRTNWTNSGTFRTGQNGNASLTIAGGASFTNGTYHSVQ